MGMLKAYDSKHKTWIAEFWDPWKYTQYQDIDLDEEAERKKDAEERKKEEEMNLNLGEKLKLRK